MDEDKQDKHWMLERRIPVFGLAGLGFQTLVIVWAMGGLFNRVEVLERQVASFAPQVERLIRLETKLESLREGLVEIKALLRPPPRT